MSNDDRALSEPAWTILRTLQWTTGYLKKHGIDNARPDAETLLSHALRCERIDLYLNHDQPLQSQELGRFKSLIQRRSQREPVAYIIGTKEFWSLEFKVTPDVLIPRPETEGLVESALACGAEKDALNVLELGTGSGIISVALAHERPSWNCWASDISGNAINVARQNAHRLLQRDHIKFWVGHWFDAVRGGADRFDLIVSNPPYISKDDLAGLEPDVSQFEPSLALDGGADGMTGVAHIMKCAHRYMKPGGWLLLEIGYDQGAAVQELGRSFTAYHHIDVGKDYAGLDRIVRLQKIDR